MSRILDDPYRVRAKHSVVAEDDDHLTFRGKAVMEVSAESQDNMWLLATKADHQSGWIPKRAVFRLDKNGNEKPDDIVVPEDACGRCLEPLGNEYVLAFEGPGGLFHQKCFVCTVCHEDVLDKGFANKYGLLFCPNCYHNDFAPRCGGCMQPIKGKYIKAMNQTWHKEHFVCKECGAFFGDAGFHQYEDSPYCRKHFLELFSARCAKCNHVIDGRMFDANGSQYHIGCFTCSHRDHPIEDGMEFHMYEDKIYCRDHFNMLFFVKCHRCHEQIEGSYALVQELSFHYKKCFTCQNCHREINRADKYHIQYHDIMCDDCHKRSSLATPPMSPLTEDGGDSNLVSPRPPVVSPVASTRSKSPLQMRQSASEVWQSDWKPPTVSATFGNVGARSIANDEEEDVFDDKIPIDAPVKTTRRRGLTRRTSSREVSPSGQSVDDSGSSILLFPYSELVNFADLPIGANRSKLEQHLNEEEFMTVFRMNKKSFNLLPKWRQKNLKVAAGLF